MGRRAVQPAKSCVGVGEVVARHRVESRLQHVEQACVGDKGVARIITAGLACIDRQTHAAHMFADRAAAGRRPFVKEIQKIFDGAKVARAGKANGDGDGQAKLVHGTPPKWQRATRRGAALVQSFVEVCSTLIAVFGCMLNRLAVRHG